MQYTFTDPSFNKQTLVMVQNPAGRDVRVTSLAVAIRFIRRFPLYGFRVVESVSVNNLNRPR